MTEMQTTTTPRLPGAFRMGRLIRSSQLSATVGSVILIVIVAAALLAPLIAPYPPNKLDVLNALQAPSWSHLMGTDDVGRDVFSRVLYGVRLDIVVVLLVTYLPLPVGAPRRHRGLLPRCDRRCDQPHRQRPRSPSPSSCSSSLSWRLQGPG